MMNGNLPQPPPKGDKCLIPPDLQFGGFEYLDLQSIIFIITLQILILNTFELLIRKNRTESLDNF